MLAFVGGLLSAAVTQADPLKSPECGTALQSLQAARGATAAPAQVEALRQQASLLCLGSAPAGGRPGRVAQAPISVPPPRIEAPAVAPPALVAPPPALPPVHIERPGSITSCDAGGCWISDGGRLQHRPPLGAGAAGGPCQLAGSALLCP